MSPANAWQAVTLAAGAGARMQSTLPKALHPLWGAPLIEHVLAALSAAGLGRPVVVAAPDADALRAQLAPRAAFAVQAAPTGTADALASARDAIGPDTRHLLVVNGDCPLLPADALARVMAAHESSGARLTLLTATPPLQSGLGRVLRDATGAVTGIVEERDATAPQRAVDEVNGGVYAVAVDGLWDALALLPAAANGERYLTALAATPWAASGVGIATVQAADPRDVIGVNTRADLALASSAMQARIRERWLAAGVTLADPATTYIDCAVEIGADTVVHPNTHLQGATVIGAGCVVGPNAVVRDSVVGDGCTVVASMLEGAALEAGADVGPFSHLRPGSRVGRGAHVGNFVEVKESALGAGVQAGHFSYVGDTTVGDGANIGAGTVTANYDGAEKHRTTIGAGALVGANTVLVAPVRVGVGARTGAGAVVRDDVEDGDTVVGVPARPVRRRGDKAVGGQPGKPAAKG